MDLTQKREDFGTDNQSWLASRHGTNSAKPATLDTSLFTKATHYPDGFFKSGIPLAKLTTGGKYGPYDNAATDGRQTLVGVLLAAVGAPASTDTDVVGAVLLHGIVDEANLPIAIDAAGKADVAGRLIFT